MREVFADVSDRATAIEEAERDRSIRAARESSSRRRLAPIGTCHFCEEPVSPKQLFCNGDCANDWSREDAFLRANNLKEDSP